MSTVTRRGSVGALPPLLVPSPFELADSGADPRASSVSSMLPPMPVQPGPLPFHLDPRGGFVDSTDPATTVADPLTSNSPAYVDPRPFADPRPFVLDC